MAKSGTKTDSSPNQVLHVFDLLSAGNAPEMTGVVVFLGDDRFLKQLALNHLDDLDPENPFGRHQGSELEWQDVADELATISLFSTGPRRVFVSEADEFVTRNRPALEKFTERPSSNGTLLLDLKKLASNTKLYKAVSKSGLIVECKFPQILRGKKSQPDTAKANQWVTERAAKVHQIKLQSGAQQLLAELVDWNFGRLDQELAKLALFVGKGETAEVELVEKVVGGWRTQTTWEMIDRACLGDAAAALEQLDKLLQSGESPQALFGSIAWSLRRFAAAVRLYEQQEKMGAGRPSMKQVLQDAGFRAWPQGALDKAAAELKQIGRERASKIYDWLLRADLSLKGSHAAPDRARLVLENLILKLSDKAKPPRAAS